MTHCPSSEQLRQLLADQLTGPQAEAVESHVQACAGCQQALELLTANPASSTDVGAGDSGASFLHRLEQAPPTPARLFRGQAAGAGADAVTPSGRPAAPAWPALPGYEVLGELGRGGMGVVYKARQVRLQRLVAIKMILAGGHAGEEELARFRAEAEAVARLQHPNIVQIHEVGEQDGRPFFVLEYVDGGGLDRKLAGTPQPAPQAAKLVETLARAVHSAHEKGIVHRDLKPANILLQRIATEDTDGTEKEPQESPSAPPASSVAHFLPKITDFGLAKRLDVSLGPTRTGAVMGTPSYMAPEQARGRNQEVGPVADTYALGAILYECLTGRPPFQGENSLDTLQQALTCEPVAPRALQPKVPRDLETICLKCLQKEPRRRYASARELADDLCCWQNGEPIRARPVGLVGRLWRWGRRRPAVAGLLAALAALVLVTLVTETWLLVRAERMRQLAETRKAEAENHLAEAAANLKLAREAADNYVTRVSENLRLRQQDLRPLRKELLETVVPFYERLIERHSDDPAIQLERARAYRRLAYLVWEIDKKGKAIALQEQAAAVFDELAARHPEAPEYRQELARSRNKLGQFYEQAGRAADAEKQLHEALTLRARLVHEHGDNDGYRHHLAQSHNDRGLFFSRTDRRALAEEEYRKAIDLLGPVALRHPDNAEYQRDLAGAHNNLGLVLHQTQRAPLAEEQLRAAWEIREALARRHPDVADYEFDLAHTYMNLGVLCERPERAAEAEELYDQALKLCRKLAEQHPSATDYQQLHGQMHSNLAGLYAATKRLPQAEAAYKEALDVLRPLAEKHGEAAVHHEDLARVRQELALHYLRTNKPSLAEAEYQEACRILRGLAERPARDPRYRRELAQAHASLAALYYDTGRAPQGEAEFRQAVAIQEQLAQEHAGTAEYALGLGITCYNWGRRERRAGKFEAAADLFGQALQQTEAARQEEALRAKARELAMSAHWERALARGQMGRHAEAVQDWDRALELDRGPNRVPFLLSRAASRARLGEHAQAVREAEAAAADKPLPANLLFAQARVYALAAPAAERDARLPEAERVQESARYADEAIKVLEQALAAGYKDLERLKTDPDFEALRTREQFKKLLAGPGKVP